VRWLRHNSRRIQARPPVSPISSTLPVLVPVRSKSSATGWGSSRPPPAPYHDDRSGVGLRDRDRGASQPSHRSWGSWRRPAQATDRVGPCAAAPSSSDRGWSRGRPFPRVRLCQPGWRQNGAGHVTPKQAALRGEPRRPGAG
jgi:hypothetical protein